MNNFEYQRQKIINIPLITDLLNTIPISLIILNSERQAVFVNKRLYDIIDEDNQDDVIGSSPGNIFRCQHIENGGDCGHTEFCRYCGANTAINCCFQGKPESQECRMFRKKNNELEALDLMVWTYPFKLEDDLFTLFSIVDISDFKRRKALEHIFFHDVLNSASALMGFLEMKNHDFKSFEHKDLNKIHQYTASIVDDIQSQRDLFLAENNDLAFKYRKIDSCKLLEQTVNKYKTHKLAKDRNIVMAESENVTFSNDPALLDRVLGNLIKNGLEAINPGQTISTGSNQLKDNVKFWVHTPTFISMDTQKQLFNRSFSTKGKDRGIGMYSVRLLTERYLKGKVYFVSEKNKGAVFNIVLPTKMP